MKKIKNSCTIYSLMFHQFPLSFLHTLCVFVQLLLGKQYTRLSRFAHLSTYPLQKYYQLR